jgi:transposase
MANVLKMAIIHSVQSLHAAGWSQRRIARELGIDRGTVAKALRPAPPDPKPAIPPTGSDDPKPATFPALPAPLGERDGGNDQADFAAGSKPAIPPTGSEGERLPPAAVNRTAAATAAAEPRAPSLPGRTSQCEPFREQIEGGLERQLSAQRIWQDLVAEHGFNGGYDSVKRFVRRLGNSTPLPFRRLESEPGAEAQVDFGTGAPVLTPDGQRRRTWVFRIVLSHSRKAYSEATYTQTTEDFFRCLENAFAHFGGVPRTLVIDNLKAAVAHPDWFDPVLTPKVQSFCEHYGTTILPTRPYTPRHKGKVEAGVKYVKNNALRARQFESLDEENRCLADWERTVADTRIHGTTKRQVQQVFEQVERAALLPRPLERFACFHEAKRKVHRDGHVEVAKAYYSAPPEYLGREIWVRWDARLVRLFNQRFEPIAVHTRHEPGRFSTHPQHLAAAKISGLERGVSYLLTKVSLIGPWTEKWSDAMVRARGIAGTRVLQGLLALTKKHSSAELEKACEIALSHGCWRLQTIRHLATRGGDKQEPLPFLDEHPLIRPLSDYGAVVAQALQRQADRFPDSSLSEDRSSRSEGFRRHGSGVQRVREESSQNSQEENSQEESSPKENSPGDQSRQGCRTSLTRPRAGYPSPSCTSAEPSSVSPDSLTVVRFVSLSTSPE